MTSEPELSAENDLLPCPFCGSEAALERTVRSPERMGRTQWWGVVCRNAMNRGGTCAIEQRPSATAEAAAERWNRRSSPQPVQPSGRQMPGWPREIMGKLRPIAEIAKGHFIWNGKDVGKVIREVIKACEYALASSPSLADTPGSDEGERGEGLAARVIKAATTLAYRAGRDGNTTPADREKIDTDAIRALSASPPPTPGKHYEDCAFLWGVNPCNCGYQSQENNSLPSDDREGLKKLRDRYASQAKFADHEAAAYFRDFVQEIDALSPAGRDQAAGGEES